MQKEITTRQPLLDEQGNIANPGYAKKLLWDYNRENITASRARIKEWDYYYIGCDEHALCLTVADMGYVGALSISVMDFVTPSQFTNSSIFLFPMGKLHMPRSSESGDVSWTNGKTHMTFTCDGKTRHLTGVFTMRTRKATTWNSTSHSPTSPKKVWSSPPRSGNRAISITTRKSTV